MGTPSAGAPPRPRGSCPGGPAALRRSPARRGTAARVPRPRRPPKRGEAAGKAARPPGALPAEPRLQAAPPPSRRRLAGQEAAATSGSAAVRGGPGCPSVRAGGRPQRPPASRVGRAGGPAAAGWGQEPPLPQGCVAGRDSHARLSGSGPSWQLPALRSPGRPRRGRQSAGGCGGAFSEGDTIGKGIGLPFLRRRAESLNVSFTGAWCGAVGAAVGPPLEALPGSPCLCSALCFFPPKVFWKCYQRYFCLLLDMDNRKDEKSRTLCATSQEGLKVQGGYC